MSRAELARRMAISKPTVSALVQQLSQSRLVQESGLVPSNGGRPGRLVAFNPAAGFVIGMDIGGTSARAAIADLDGRLLGSVRAGTRGAGKAELITQIQEFCTTLLWRAGVEAERLYQVAIGTPGVVDPLSQEVAYAPNVPALEEPGFLEDLRRALGTKVSLHNDANMAAVGEAERGAGAEAQSFVYLTIGTGLGATLVVDGRVYAGSAGRAGEIGYLPLAPGSAQDLEGRLSGPGLSAAHVELGGSGSTVEIFAEAAGLREPGTSVVRRMVEHLGWAVTVLATTFDPELLILGGGIGALCSPYLEDIRRAAEAGSTIVPRLEISALGDEAGLVGAVAMALRQAEPLSEQALPDEPVPTESYEGA